MTFNVICNSSILKKYGSIYIIMVDKPIENCITDPSQDDDNILCRASAINSNGELLYQRSLENCNNVFSCNNGYKFKPTIVKIDLLVTKCMLRKVLKLNVICS